MNLRGRVAALLSLLWRVSVLALLVWNAVEVRQARQAAETAGVTAGQALQAVDELSNLIDEALGSDSGDDPQAQQGT